MGPDRRRDRRAGRGGYRVLGQRQDADGRAVDLVDLASHDGRRRPDPADRRPRRTRVPAPSGKQTVAVTGGPSQIEGIPLVVALRSDPANNGARIILDNKNIVLYRMCGLGKDCSIKEGKPSKRARPLPAPRGARAGALHVQLRRRHRRCGVLMPPVPGKKPSHAVFFRPQDVAAVAAEPAGRHPPGPDAEREGR